MPKIQRALLSTFNKEGIVTFARTLVDLEVQILSTGGTSKLLRENKIPVIDVSDYTGQPEILDGRLKTLHPKIHGGVLAIRSNKKHLDEMKKSGIEPIDLLVVNLYPFEETVQKSDVTLEEAIENIDIGGPTMLRAAAKNWQDVTVICDPADYDSVLNELKKGAASGAPTISKETNFRLAKKVFALTARYDAAISNYLSGGMEGSFPQTFTFQGEKIQALRYGENPHQRGAFYRVGGEGVATAKQLHGKELSFNNILDLDAAIETVGEFETAACVIIKHTNPCGVAVRSPSPPEGACPAQAREGLGVREVFLAARSCDPLSAFGGIIAMNREIDLQTAGEIAKDFYECVVAPSFSKEAFEILAKKKNIRLMELGVEAGLKSETSYDIKKVSGGFLVQDLDRKEIDIRQCQVVTTKKPSDEEWAALDFAWRVVKHLKSNAIVMAGEGEGILRLFGAGAGQMSRIDSVRIAISKFEGMDQGLPLDKPVVLASDAFFPFRDSVDEAAEAGVTAIIQPGGSLKDQESIEAANGEGIAMVFTGLRHFRH